MLYYILVGLSNLCCILPETVTRFIGKVLGEITWLVVPQKRKKMASRNIERCLKVSSDEARSMAKKVGLVLVQ